MNDHDAIEAIRAALDAWFRGKRGSLETTHLIAGIIGENVIDHDESKEQK